MCSEHSLDQHVGRVRPEGDLEERARHPPEVGLTAAAAVGVGRGGGGGDDAAEERLEVGRVLELLGEGPARQDVVDDDVQVVEDLGAGGLGADVVGDGAGRLVALAGHLKLQFLVVIFTVVFLGPFGKAI